MPRRALVLSIIALIALALPVSACYITVVGSANTVSRDYDFRDFARVEVGSSFEVDIVRGDSYRVSITSNENLFENDNIEVSRSGDTLSIRLRPGPAYIRTTQKANISMPDISGIDLSGAVRGKLRGFSFTHTMDASLSGSSALEIEALETGDLNLSASGASRVSGQAEAADCRFELSGASRTELTGLGANLDAEASGASRFLLAEFSVNNVDITLSGASQAEIKLNGRLDGEISGASRLVYSGNPTLGRLVISGGSSISEKE